MSMFFTCEGWRGSSSTWHSALKRIALLCRLMGILCRSSSTTSSSEVAVLAGKLECTFTCKKSNIKETDDMSNYEVVVTSEKILKGHVKSMLSKSADNDAWKDDVTSSHRIRFEAGKPKKIHISGKWADDRYYKLMVLTVSKEAYKTPVFLKKNGSFEKLGAKKQEEPRDDKKGGQEEGGTNWESLCFYGVIAVLVLVLGALVLKHYKKQ